MESSVALGQPFGWPAKRQKPRTYDVVRQCACGKFMVWRVNSGVCVPVEKCDCKDYEPLPASVTLRVVPRPVEYVPCCGCNGSGVFCNDGDRLAECRSCLGTGRVPQRYPIKE